MTASRENVQGEERLEVLLTQFDHIVRILKIEFPDHGGLEVPMVPLRSGPRKEGVVRVWLECRKCYCKYECVEDGVAYKLQVCLECYCLVAMHML